MEARATFSDVITVIKDRLAHGAPSGSYVAQLAAQGEDAILQKIGEECTEVLLAAKNGERAASIHEVADLQFHLLVWMTWRGIALEDIEAELGRRFGRSGLDTPAGSQPK